jgi:SH3-like domain-containing protein
VQPIFNAIHIRSGPGEEYNEIALLYQDETAIVVGTDDFGNWYEVRTEDGQEGWVAASVVEIVEGQIVLAVSPTAASQLTGDSETPRLQVTVSSAYIRSGPGQNYPVIDSVTQGTTVTVLGYTSSGTWFNVRLSDGRRGWIGASVTEQVGGWTLQEISVAGTVPALPAGGNNQQVTPLPATTTSSAVCGCSGNIYNCSNFGSQGAAQACYEYCLEQIGWDVHDLDRDNDGWACEALP